MATRELWITIGARTEGLQAGIGRAQAGLASLNDQLEKSATKRWVLSDIGLKLGLVGAAALAASGVAAKAAMDWESSWAGVAKTVDGTDSQMTALERSLRNMAKTLPATHQEIAAVAEAAGQLGVKVGDIASFTKVMIELGDTTNLTAEEAATSIAQVMNVMKTAPKDVDNFASSLVALGNNGASTEQDILQMAKYISGAAATVGMSEQDVLGLANALSSVGIEAEAGGSSVSRILIDMSKAAKTNSVDMDIWAATAGKTSAEWKKLVETNPAEAFTAFTKGLNQVNEAGGDTYGLMAQLGQSDIRVTRALLAMAASGNLLTDSLHLSSKAWDENTALAKEAGQRYDTTAAKATVAINNIRDDLIDFGQDALPVISEMSDSVTWIANAFGKLPDPIQGGTTAMLAFGGVALIAAGGILKAISTVAELRAGLAMFAEQSPRASSAFGLLGRALGALAIAGTVAAGLEKASTIDVGGVNEYTRALLKASQGNNELLTSLTSVKGAWGSFGEDLNGVKDAFKAAQEAKDSWDVSFAHDSSMERGTRMVKQMDSALASMVQSGSFDQAAKSFQYLQNVSGLTFDQLSKLLPQYRDALSQAATENGVAADSISTTNVQLIAQAEAQHAAQDAAKKTADEFMGFSSSLDDTTVSLSSWITELANQAKALNDFADNAIKAADRGLNQGLIASLENAGQAGALRMQQLADASDSEIARANTAWVSGQSAIENYVNKIGTVPGSVNTTVTADTSQAEAKLSSLLGWWERTLSLLGGRSISPTVAPPAPTTSLTGRAPIVKREKGGLLDFYANGGFSGPENHVAQIAPAGSIRIWAEPETGGESYIPLATSKRERSIDIWAETGRRLGVAGFANGGIVSDSGGARYGSTKTVKVNFEKGSIVTSASSEVVAAKVIREIEWAASR